MKILLPSQTTNLMCSSHALAAHCEIWPIMEGSRSFLKIAVFTSLIVDWRLRGVTDLWIPTYERHIDHNTLIRYSRPTKFNSNTVIASRSDWRSLHLYNSCCQSIRHIVRPQPSLDFPASNLNSIRYITCCTKVQGWFPCASFFSKLLEQYYFEFFNISLIFLRSNLWTIQFK